MLDTSESSRVRFTSRAIFKETRLSFVRQGSAAYADVLALCSAVLEASFDMYESSTVIRGCAKDWDKSIRFLEVLLTRTMVAGHEDHELICQRRREGNLDTGASLVSWADASYPVCQLDLRET